MRFVKTIRLALPLFFTAIAIAACGQTLGDRQLMAQCAEGKSEAECKHIVTVDVLAAYDENTDDGIPFSTIDAALKETVKNYEGRIIFRNKNLMKFRVKFRTAEDARSFMKDVEDIPYVKRVMFDPDVRPGLH